MARRVSMPRSLVGGTFALALAAAALGPALRAAPAGSPVRPGQPVATAAFHDLTGRAYTPAQLREKQAVVYLFLSTQCPVAALYTQRITGLERVYGAKGVQVVGVFANRNESAEEIRRFAAERNFSFPVVKDTDNRLADQLGAGMTPQAVVVDAAGTLRYRGRIDDHRDERKVKRHDLAAALNALLGGRKVAAAETPAFGCALRRKAAEGTAVAATDVTYSRQVSRILQKACQDCHRPGEVAPFSLLNYEQAAAWAPEIKRYTGSRQMPPWKPAPGFGDLHDARRLTDEEIAILGRWADAGAPEGDPRELPEPRRFAEGWQLGEPDLVLDPGEDYHLAPTGDDVYRCFVLPAKFDENRWVKGLEVRAGNRKVVHHVIAFLDSSGGAEKLDEKDPGPGYSSYGGGIGVTPSGMLGGWAPGNEPRLLLPGIGGLLPKGARIVLQVHYHKSGKSEVDRTKIGIHFAKEPIDKQLRLALPLNFFFEIPAGAKRHEVKASWNIIQDSHAYYVAPHMHLLGREVKVTATLPDGSVKPMVWIRDWDFNWQNGYTFKQPIALPKGSRIDVVAYYDNSEENPRNPSKPPKPARWGEQTTDEMCIAFVGLTQDDEHLLKAASR